MSRVRRIDKDKRELVLERLQFLAVGYRRNSQPYINIYHDKEGIVAQPTDAELRELRRLIDSVVGPKETL